MGSVISDSSYLSPYPSLSLSSAVLLILLPIPSVILTLPLSSVLQPGWGNCGLYSEGSCHSMVSHLSSFAVSWGHRLYSPVLLARHCDFCLLKPFTELLSSDPLNLFSFILLAVLSFPAWSSLLHCSFFLLLPWGPFKRYPSLHFLLFPLSLILSYFSVTMPCWRKILWASWSFQFHKRFSLFLSISLSLDQYLYFSFLLN